MWIGFPKPVCVELANCRTVKKSEICNVNGFANQHTCSQNWLRLIYVKRQSHFLRIQQYVVKHATTSASVQRSSVKWTQNRDSQLSALLVFLLFSLKLWELTSFRILVWDNLWYYQLSLTPVLRHLTNYRPIVTIFFLYLQLRHGFVALFVNSDGDDIF